MEKDKDSQNFSVADLEVIEAIKRNIKGATPEDTQNLRGDFLAAQKKAGLPLTEEENKIAETREQKLEAIARRIAESQDPKAQKSRNVQAFLEGALNPFGLPKRSGTKREK